MQKEYRVQVLANVDDSEVKGLESLIDDLKMQQLQLRIKTNTSRLDEVNTEIENAKAKLADLKGKADVDDSDIKKVETELAQLESEKINLQIAVAKDELTQAKAEEEALNTTSHVDIEVNDTAVQTSMANIQSGLNDIKAGFSDVAQGMGDVLQSAGRMEQTETFLTMNLGADQAKSKLNEIREVTDKLPGDDVALQSLLSQSALKDTKLGAKEFEQMGGAAADYMAAMTNFGKTSTETQQDLMNYILQGNTAEIERSPVLQAHVDKLSEATTIQERSKALEEALNEEGWKGISRQDTYNNKLQTFSDLIERGKMNFGGLFLDGTKGAMGFIGEIDEATGGVLGMGAALVSEFGPGLFQGAQGLVSMGSGLTTMSKEFGGIMPMLSSFAGEIPLVGGALSSLSLGPVALVIAALVALGVAIYEVGKAFGWWSDLGTMFEAITAGAQQMWNAFMSNEYVIQAIDMIKQGLTDAWNAIVGLGQAIMSALGGAGGQFDILSWAINGLQMVLNAVGPVVVLVIQGMIQHFRNIYTVAQIVWPYIAGAIQSAIGTVTGIINGARAVFQGLVNVWNTVSSAVSSMCSAITGGLSAAGAAWESFKNMVMTAAQPILDVVHQIQSVGGDIWKIMTGGSGGFEMPISGAGSGGGNTTVSQTVSQGNTIIFNMYGDVRDEKTIDDMINAINERLQFESLANGVTSNNNGVI